MDGVVENTLYIPLAARAYVTKRFPEFFKDETSAMLDERVPASVKEGSNEYTMMASVCRYHITDGMERDFASKHPDRCNIIHIGTGLETAYIRLEDIGAHFYDMDLPDVIELRKSLLPPKENETVIAGDMFDLSWADGIDEKVPTMILALGVFQYFEEDRIVDLVGKLKERFPGSELVFDATNTKGVKYTNKYIHKTGNTAAEVHMAVDDPREFADKTGTVLLEVKTFYEDSRKVLGRKLTLYTRIAMKVVDDSGRARVFHLSL